MSGTLKILSKILMAAFGVLFGIILTVYAITAENSLSISQMLGSKTFVMIQNGDSNQDTDYYTSDYTNLADLMSDGRDLVAEVEASGAVLLKNDKMSDGKACLPLNVTDGEKNVSVFSVASVSPAFGGAGSAASDNPGPAVTIKEGFSQAGIEVNNSLYSFYTSNLTKYQSNNMLINDAPWTAVSTAASASFSQYSDAAIVIVKRIRGESTDLGVTGSDGNNGNFLELNANEMSVLRGIASLKGTTFKKTIVLFNAPNQVEMAFLNDPELKIDAALWIGSVGQTGMNAVGDILAGKVNPSGKLADTYWLDHSDNPVMANFGVHQYTNYSDYNLPGEGGAGSYTSMKYSNYVVYKEGIFMGYRYTETRYEDVVAGRPNAGNFNYAAVVAYPFGHGLSYAEFEYSNFKAEKKGDTYEVSVNVKNNGEIAGREVIQIYLQKPYTQYDVDNGIEKAAVELVGFKKSKLLAPGENETVKLTISERDFSSYDAENSKTYVLDAGKYFLTVGRDAHDAVNNILAVRGYTKVDGMDADGNANMVFQTNEYSFNATKYATEDKTKTSITNLFQQADINKYENKGSNIVEYVSRSDWNGTLPSNDSDSVKLSMTSGMYEDLMAQRVSNIAPDEKKNPTFGKSSGLKLVDMRVDGDGKKIPYNDLAWDTFMDQLTFDETAALISTGMRKTGAVESIVKPATIEHNGPTGLTQTYGTSAYSLASIYGDKDKAMSPPYYPSISVLASSFDTGLALEVGKMYGEDSLWAGYNGLYGIGVNMHRTAYDGRSFEYYSEDPYLSGMLAAEVVTGLQEHGCSAYVKHLALYEQQQSRVGLSVWLNEQTYRELYLEPFRIAIIKGGAKNAMTSYNRNGVTLCPANSALLNGFLRNECGMTGLVVSDMWSGRYSDDQLALFLMSGCDLPDGDIANAKLYDKYKEGYGNVTAAMREAAKRILYTTAHGNAMNGYSSDTIIRNIIPDWQMLIIIGTIVMGVLFAISTAAFIMLSFRKKDTRISDKSGFFLAGK